MTAEQEGQRTPYGLIGGLRANPGQRDALVEVLRSGTGQMPGCLQYVVAEDLEDPDLLWVIEVWESAEAHQASLGLPEVNETIRRGRPLIAGFEQRREIRPVVGLQR